MHLAVSPRGGAHHAVDLLGHDESEQRGAGLRGVPREAHGQRFERDSVSQLMQVAFRGAPGCTSFGCTILNVPFWLYQSI